MHCDWSAEAVPTNRFCSHAITPAYVIFAAIRLVPSKGERRHIATSSPLARTRLPRSINTPSGMPSAGLQLTSDPTAYLYPAPHISPASAPPRRHSQALRQRLSHAT